MAPQSRAWLGKEKKKQQQKKTTFYCAFNIVGVFTCEIA